MAFSPCQGRAAWADFPLKVTSTWQVPTHPTSSAPSVGSGTTASSASSTHGLPSKTASSPFSAWGPSPRSPQTTTGHTRPSSHRHPPRASAWAARGPVLGVGPLLPLVEDEHGLEAPVLPDEVLHEREHHRV